MVSLNLISLLKSTALVTLIGIEVKPAIVGTFISLLNVLTPVKIRPCAFNNGVLVFGKLRVVSFDVITGPDSETFKPFLKVIISSKVLGAKKIFVEESFAKSDVSIAL